MKIVQESVVMTNDDLIFGIYNQWNTELENYCYHQK